MYTLTIRHKFNFGDRVRFDSNAQMRPGEGVIMAITVDDEGRIDYGIRVPEGQFIELEMGVLEEEITLLE